MQPTLCSPVKLPAHLNCNPTKSPRGCTGAGQSNHRLLAQGPDRLTDRRASVEFVRTHAFFPCLLTYPTYICRYLPYSTYVAENGIHPGQACQPSPAQKIWGKEEEGGFKGGYTRRRGLIYSFYEILRALCHALPNTALLLLNYLCCEILSRTLSLMRDMIWQCGYD